MNELLKRSARLLSALLVFAVLADSAWAQVIDTGLFTQNRARQCSTDTACIGGDPTLLVTSDFDLSDTGQVSTQVNIPELGAQGASSAGFDGEALTPAISTYAYTSGPQRYTISTFGFQRYEFLESGQVTLDGTLTYSQSGESSPRSENPRGRVFGSFMAFQFDDDQFDASRCNLFIDYSQSNIAGSLRTCVTRNGESLGSTTIHFDGLYNVQSVNFPSSDTAVSNGSEQAQLVVSGNAGDVFFVGASLSVLAHLGGWADTGNTLRIKVDNPAILEPAFNEQSFVPASPRMASIDIKPGDEDNCVNINGAGVIPVGILGSDALDVFDLDPYSLRFGGMDVRIRGKKGPLCHTDYVDGDNYLDMVCQFEDDPSQWLPGIGEATVMGAKYDGTLFQGTDTICIVPEKAK